MHNDSPALKEKRYEHGSTYLLPARGNLHFDLRLVDFVRPKVGLL
jgi:hypothetical protein